MDTAPSDWTEANQAFLAAALSRIKACLARRGTAQVGAEAALPAFVGAPPALERIARGFGLSRFERDLLLLCAGVELDAEIATLCAQAAGDPARMHPTFSLALGTLPEAHWSALSPDAPLRRWRLIEPGEGPSLTLAPLRIDERVLHCLAGVRQLDERLAALLEVLPPADPADLVPSQRDAATEAASAWRTHAETVVQLLGDATDCRPVAAAAAAMVGLRVAALPVALLPAGPTELDALLRLWQRETVLAAPAVLMLDDESAATETHAFTRLLQRVGGPLIVRAREPRAVVPRQSVVLDVTHPQPDEQAATWRSALGAAAPEDLPGQLAAQFSLSLPAIEAIAAGALARDRAAGALARDAAAGALGDVVWRLCRLRLRTRLEGLAQHIESRMGWHDLVLPETQTQTLHTIAAQLRQRNRVHEEWGFGAKGRRGLGIAALFAGASGTGKTLAAEVLAGELRLDLFRIDLAAVMSKYIGETEKNLRRVFDAAEESGAVLLFDEADALFGKRSEVKDSHDRYANIEVSYLLQRMEAYRGLAILTTNMKSALDPAFLRRLRFVVTFPFPDAAQRAAIWRQVFPAATPLDGVDAERLALLRLPGGAIRNIAMSAAFLAADCGEPVRMHHLRTAARSEYAKLERPLTQAENEAWA
ncbi:MAG: ATP-binding protein [Alphaproteobacteria bacterium]|nr:ATP-binding protein [Alphaproteobacteria bacterium]